MIETLLAIADALLFAMFLVALILGLSCVVMAFISNKTGAEALKERIEYGFMGISGLAIMGLLAYAMA